MKAFRALTRRLQGMRSAWHRRRRIDSLRRDIRVAQPCRVILGDGGLRQEGWIGTDRDLLDITQPRDWERLFRPASIDRLLAEHVLEHLTLDENRASLRLALPHLKPRGRFRIAVPDGHRDDPDYRREVAPPKDGHQVLFTRESLTELLEACGFEVEPLEYFDATGQFHAHAWSPEDGHVHRSLRHDRQENFARDGHFYTSLIVDGIRT